MSAALNTALLICCGNVFFKLPAVTPMAMTLIVCVMILNEDKDLASGPTFSRFENSLTVMFLLMFPIQSRFHSDFQKNQHKKIQVLMRSCRSARQYIFCLIMDLIQ